MEESRIGRAVSWVCLAASFALSAETWVALARLAGYSSWSSWFMPAVVDGYIVASLMLWLSPVPERVAALARRHTYGAALIGVVVQSVFHSATVWDRTGSVWRCVVAAAVGALPPLFAAFAVHARALMRREHMVHQPEPVVHTAVHHVAPSPAPVVQPVVQDRQPELVRVGAPPEPKLHNGARVAEVHRLVALDLSDTEIAKQLGVHRNTVARLKKLAP